MADYEIGTTVRLSMEFRTRSTNALVNPSTVTLDLRSPSGVESVVTVVNDSTGLYHGDVTPDAAGKWDYRWEGNGTQSVAYEGQINVRESAFDSP